MNDCDEERALLAAILKASNPDSRRRYAEWLVSRKDEVRASMRLA